MAATKAVYEENSEFTDLASKLITKYPGEFGGIDSTKIKCYAINNKERSEKKKLWTVDVVKRPISDDLKSYLYCFTIYLNDWLEFNDAQKAAMVAEALCSLPIDGEDKKNTPDIQGYHKMFNTFGLDFMSDPKLPNLITDDVKFKS